MFPARWGKPFQKAFTESLLSFLHCCLMWWSQRYHHWTFTLTLHQHLFPLSTWSLWMKRYEMKDIVVLWYFATVVVILCIRIWITATFAPTLIFKRQEPAHKNGKHLTLGSTHMCDQLIKSPETQTWCSSYKFSSAVSGTRALHETCIIICEPHSKQVKTKRVKSRLRSQPFHVAPHARGESEGTACIESQRCGCERCREPHPAFCWRFLLQLLLLAFAGHSSTIMFWYDSISVGPNILYWKRMHCKYEERAPGVVEFYFYSLPRKYLTQNVKLSPRK